MSTKKMQYSSIGKIIDGTTYCSGVETLAENMIEDNENDAVVVYPFKSTNRDMAFGSLRSSAYTMTTDNAEAHLPSPIYKVSKFFIMLDNIKFEWTETSKQTAYLSDFKNAAGESISALDITKFVIPQSEWDSLPISDFGAVDAIPKYCFGLFKDNTFYWEKGESKIPFLGTVYKQGISFLSNDRPTYERLIDTIFYEIGSDYKCKPGLVEMSLKSAVLATKAEIDVRKWKFHIEYIPLTSKTKIRARKNAPTNMDYIQPFNQRAEINSASALGKNMWITAQKTGCTEIKLVKNYTSFKDIPPLGALVNHNGRKYKLVANHYVMTNIMFIQVTHTLSENWAEKSKHVAVDQKYRNYKIPQDILWRNLYYEDYFRAGQSKKEKIGVDGGVEVGNILQLFNNGTSDYKPIDSFVWLFGEANAGTKDTNIGARLPCSSYGIANSIIFSASFKDNVSAGLSRGDGNKCEDVFYCHQDGTLVNATIQLGYGNLRPNRDYFPGIRVWEDYDTGEYKVENNLEEVLFDKTFKVYKDAGEAIKFTYQIHTIGEDGVVIGRKFSEHNPLVKDWNGVGRQFKFYKLKYYIPEGTDIVTLIDEQYDTFSISSLAEIIAIAKEEQSTDDLAYYGETYTGEFTSDIVKAWNTTDKAWAITDEKGNLYIGCNNPSVDKNGMLLPIYFQLHHKRNMY